MWVLVAPWDVGTWTCLQEVLCPDLSDEWVAERDPGNAMLVYCLPFLLILATTLR
jgi:hypothetical protein